MTRPARYWTAWAAATILVGAWLRLYDLGAMEFKGDEQESLTLAMRLLADHPWSSGLPFPTHGMVSSNAGRAQPPALYLDHGGAVGAHSRSRRRGQADRADQCALPLFPVALGPQADGRTAGAADARALRGVAIRGDLQPEDLAGGSAVARCARRALGDRMGARPRPWRGVVLLLLAALVAGQLHLSAPIALALLPIALVIQSLVDRRRGEPGLRFTRPSAVEAAALAIAVGSTCSSGFHTSAIFSACRLERSTIGRGSMSFGRSCCARSRRRSCRSTCSTSSRRIVTNS